METFWNSDIKYLESTMTKIMCIWGKSPPEVWGKSLPGGILPHAGGVLPRLSTNNMNMVNNI